MSDDDDVFRLNSLHRYDKRSRLVLEAHSHCEVPAGCGGAVFQWVNPSRGVTVRVHAMTPLRLNHVAIDGVAVPSVGLRLLRGAHVLALEFGPAAANPRVPAVAGLAPWALVYLEVRLPGVPTYPVQRMPRSESRDDGTWLALDAAPESGWQAPEFDDSRWARLQRSPTAGRALESWQKREFERELAAGCVPLALPTPHAVLRKRFDFDGGGQR